MFWRNVRQWIQAYRIRYRRFPGHPSDVEVFDRDAYRMMRLIDDQTLIQGKQHRTIPLDFGLNYLRQHLLAALIYPNPQRILVLGLGVGALPRLLQTIYPDAQCTVVELNPGVISAASECFGFREAPGLQLYQADAREWIARYSGPNFDLIFNDCFDGLITSVKTRSHEMTMRLCSFLNPSGALITNQLRQEYAQSAHQDQQGELPVPLCWPADGKTNLTIVHIPQSLDWDTLSSRAQAVDNECILPFKLHPEILRLNQVP